MRPSHFVIRHSSFVLTCGARVMPCKRIIPRLLTSRTAASSRASTVGLRWDVGEFGRGSKAPQRPGRGRACFLTSRPASRHAGCLYDLIERVACRCSFRSPGRWRKTAEDLRPPPNAGADKVSINTSGVNPQISTTPAISTVRNARWRRSTPRSVPTAAAGKFSCTAAHAHGQRRGWRWRAKWSSAAPVKYPHQHGPRRRQDWL